MAKEKKIRVHPGMIMGKSIDYTPVRINVEHTYPADKHATIKHLDDEKMVVDQSQVNWIILGLSLLGVILLGSIFFMDDDKSLRFPNPHHPAYIIMSIMIVFAWIGIGTGFAASVYFFLNSFLNSKKVFIFNRKEGTITYPEFLWRTSKTIPFEEANFIRCRVGPYAGEVFHLAILRADGITRSVITWDKPERYLSYFAQYMDKNRPLPPGTALDPYRERDYERRKAEGFPEPLYGARITTPDIGPQPDRYKGEMTLPEMDTLWQEAKKRG
jgi:hypothetical protein